MLMLFLQNPGPGFLLTDAILTASCQSGLPPEPCHLKRVIPSLLREMQFVWMEKRIENKMQPLGSSVFKNKIRFTYINWEWKCHLILAHKSSKFLLFIPPIKVSKVLSLWVCVTFAQCLNNSPFPSALNQISPPNPDCNHFSSTQVTNWQVPAHSAAQEHPSSTQMWRGNGAWAKGGWAVGWVLGGEVTSGEMDGTVMMNVQ